MMVLSVLLVSGTAQAVRCRVSYSYRRARALPLTLYAVRCKPSGVAFFVHTGGLAPFRLHCMRHGPSRPVSRFLFIPEGLRPAAAIESRPFATICFRKCIDLQRLRSSHDNGKVFFNLSSKLSEIPFASCLSHFNVIGPQQDFASPIFG